MSLFGQEHKLITLAQVATDGEKPLTQMIDSCSSFRLDYVGISLLIMGSFVPWLYYSFYCRSEPKYTYMITITVLGTACIIVSLWDKFSEPLFRPLRAGVFMALGLFGVVPSVHFIITDGYSAAVKEASFHWLVLMACLYIGGALLYAMRIPERFFPGKCDIWVSFCYCGGWE